MNFDIRHMDKIKAYVVDDEEAARDVLTNLLQRSQFEFEYIQKFSNLPDVVSAIKQEKPHVVFLDVQMPEYAGYEIASFFEEIDFEIIFVTAFDEYALKAFELSAVDYIVKPVERVRLTEALEKLQSKMHSSNAIVNYQTLLESIRDKELGKLIVSELSDGVMKKHVLQLSDIIAFEANGAYTQIHLKSQTPLLVSRNMKQMEDKLPEESGFMRSHRSWIINTNLIQSFNSSTREVHLENDVVAKVSKNSLDRFKGAISHS